MKGDIILDTEGIAHIEKGHGEQIRDAGFEDAESFVLQNADAVYQGKFNRTFEVITQKVTPLGRTVLRLKFKKEGDGDQIKTAGVVRRNQYKGQLPLWERAHSTLFQEENPSATRRASQRGQNGKPLYQDIATSKGGGT